MRYLFAIVTFLSAGTLMLALNGCSTSQIGATKAQGTYVANVPATPDKVTTAANAACKDLKLTNIDSSNTKVDGKVTAYDAQGIEVAIDIEQTDNNVSQVTVRIGVTGDEAMSKQIVDHIKSHLS